MAVRRGIYFASGSVVSSINFTSESAFVFYLFFSAEQGFGTDFQLGAFAGFVFYATSLYLSCFLANYVLMPTLCYKQLLAFILFQLVPLRPNYLVLKALCVPDSSSNHTGPLPHYFESHDNVLCMIIFYRKLFIYRSSPPILFHSMTAISFDSMPRDQVVWYDLGFFIAPSNK